MLRRVFDIVRTVDPRTRKVLVYAKDGCHEEEGQSCYDFWQQGQACINCISSKAYQEKTSLAKLEFLNTSMFVVISRYLEVDGRGLVLELIKQLTDQGYLDQNEHKVLLRALTASRSLLYEDTLTGAHNQRYYEELLSGQTACAAALIELTNRGEIADKYGPEATEEALTREIGALLRALRRPGGAGGRFPSPDLHLDPAGDFPLAAPALAPGHPGSLLGPLPGAIPVPGDRRRLPKGQGEPPRRQGKGAGSCGLCPGGVCELAK